MIPILFEDGEALVIDKPAGLPVDPPRSGGDSLAARMGEFKLGFMRPPVPVHRLDTDTSGCLLLARNPKALRRFAKAFEERWVEKVYLGVLAGELGKENGTIELSLAKISTARGGWRMIAARKGKPAVTHWTRLAVKDGLTLVEFRPETGRTHQIRIHARTGLGLPLLGDPVYGEADGRASRTMLHAASRTMLHAKALIVPRENKPEISAEAPLPADFAALGLTDG